MSLSNECQPFIEDTGQPRLTGHVLTAVTGKRLVSTTGRTSGPALSTATDGGNYGIQPCTAAAKPLGVAAYDGAVGDTIPVICAPGTVLPITAGGTIAAGTEVECGTGGTVVTLASGRPVGYCANGATINNDAEIKLY